MRRRAGSLPNWALGPRVQGTGELGWGQLPFLETQAGPVCLLCASIYSYEGAHACRLPLQRENEVLRWVPAPSSTPAFSQHIISFVRSSGRPLPAIPQPSLCLAGPAAWSTLPSPSHTKSRPPRKPSLTLSCHCPACPVSHGGRRGFSNWLLIPWEGRGIKRGWGETGRAPRPLHTAPSDPLPPRVPTYT